MSSPYTEKRSTLVAVPDAKTLSNSICVTVPAKSAWKIAGNFAGFDRFVDGLTRIEMTGDGIRSVRKKLFKDGHVVLEQLNTIDHEKMVMSWSLIYTTLDINNLWSAMRVERISDSESRITWDIAGEPYNSATKPDDFEAFINGFATAALANIKSILEGERRAA